MIEIRDLFVRYKSENGYANAVDHIDLDIERVSYSAWWGNLEAGRPH